MSETLSQARKESHIKEKEEEIKQLLFMLQNPALTKKGMMMLTRAIGDAKWFIEGLETLEESITEAAKI